MSKTPDLETDRLRLRERVPDDAIPLFPTMSDPDVMHWWSRPPYASVEDGIEDFSRFSDPWRSWAILDKRDDAVIGFVAAGEKRQGKVVEIGYLLAKSRWGGGFAREAVGAVIDQLFAEGNRRVFADTDPENTGSRRLLESLGFQLEGTLRGEWETHIGVRDSVIYGLLHKDWSGRGD